MTSQRLESLDSIRGLAALSVLLGHTLGAFDWPAAYTEWTRWPLLNMVADGRSAVTMFFVLSGFVLARPFLPVPGKSMHVPAFYLRRIIRIWLPWFFVFLISLVARRWLMHDYKTTPPVSDWLTHFWHQPLTWKDLAKQCFFQLHDAARLLMPQDWSLGVELKGSALIPIFLILARQRRAELWMGIFAALFLVFLPTGVYYISFIIGVMLAKYSGSWIAKVREMYFSRKLLLLSLGLMGYEAHWLAHFYHGESHWLEQTVWVITSFGCALIIFASLSSRRISGFLVRRPLVFAGQISYSVYLLQFVVLICFVPFFVQQLNRLGWGVLGIFAATLLISFGLTMVFSWLTYRWVELPSITLGHWISRSINPNKRTPAS